MVSMHHEVRTYSYELHILQEEAGALASRLRSSAIVYMLHEIVSVEKERWSSSERKLSEWLGSELEIQRHRKLLLIIVNRVAYLLVSLVFEQPENFIT